MTTAHKCRRYQRCPAFVDTHVHLSLAGEPRDNARRHYELGIGLVRDAGDRDGCLDGVDLAPLEVVRTGPALFKEGFYGRFIGDSRPLSLEEKIAAAPDGFVKVLLTGLVSFDEYGAVGPVQWSAGELAAIVKLAARYGKKVMVHVNSDAGCRLAVAAGAHSLEHGYFIAADTLKMMADRGIWWTPTVAAMANQLADPQGRFSRHQLQIIEKNYRRHLEMINYAFSVGTPLAVGTDSGSYNVPHGGAFFRELELFAAAGIAAADLLRLATDNGWRLLERPVSRWLEVDPERFPHPESVRLPAGETAVGE